MIYKNVLLILSVISAINTYDGTYSQNTAGQQNRQTTYNDRHRNYYHDPETRSYSQSDHSHTGPVYVNQGGSLQQDRSDLHNNYRRYQEPIERSILDQNRHSHYQLSQRPSVHGPVYTNADMSTSHQQQGSDNPNYGRDHDTNLRVTLPGLGDVVGGTMHSAWSRREFYKFLGIKYAKVGTGLKRFQRAELPEPWRGVYDATKQPPACPSFPELNNVKERERNHENVEDCLTLSIYTPNTRGRYPVMFYIHGEFFFDGSSKEAQPQYLLEKDVVLVSIEYRLAPFGFITTLTQEMPGNVAVADVVSALNWVKQYIRRFGGDSNRITIFGQGAGASLAHLLTISPEVDDHLFHRVILQSGTALNPYFIGSKPVGHARDIARHANCPQYFLLESIAECLAHLSTSELLTAFLKHCQEKEKDGVKNYGGFQIVIGDLYGYVPRHPFKLTRDGNDFFYPMIGGVTKDVGSFYYSKIYPFIRDYSSKDINSIFDAVLLHTIGEDDSSGLWKNLIFSEFPAIEMYTDSFADLSPVIIDFISDIFYKGPLLEALQQNAKYGYNGTYLYSFHYLGKHKRYRFHHPLPFEAGVSLSDDNIYLFPFPEEVSQLDDEDTKVAQIMVDLWTSFAETGVPKANNFTWPEMNLVTGPYAVIDTDLDTDDDFAEEFVLTSIFSFLTTFINSIVNE